jgi:REP element-mobilizing transposase RayT
VYHVYNRLALGERVFADAELAEHFVDLLREVTARDQVTVFAWCVMPNHYHLAVQTGPVSLDRPMRSVQQRFTRRFNTRQQVFGPLWQGRYRARPVTEPRYLQQLLVYIHLNPVTAGIVDDPAEYPWSGHTEIVQRARSPLIDVDEVLRVYGGTRRTARARYVRSLRGALDEPWIGEGPGRLPWWKLGRPPRGDDEDPAESGRKRRADAAERQVLERPRMIEEEFLRQGAAYLGIDLEELSGRGRRPEIVRARELLASLGVERYRLQVKRVAQLLNKHPVTATTWVMRGVRKRREDKGFSEQYEALDRRLMDG